jgi:23S rRNA (guanosine2251-2'-O)-methyltransferase
VTPVVVRASAGATEHARIARVANLVQALDALRERDFEVLGLAVEGAEDLPKVAHASGQSRVLVVGSEGRGLRRLVREHCTGLVRIPMHGPIESLNASVAAAIALYALTSAGDVR